MPAVAGRSEMGACPYHFCEYLAVDGIQYADVLREYAKHSQDLYAKRQLLTEPDRRIRSLPRFHLPLLEEPIIRCSSWECWIAGNVLILPYIADQKSELCQESYTFILPSSLCSCSSRAGIGKLMVMFVIAMVITLIQLKFYYRK